MSKNKKFTPHYQVFTNNKDLVKVGCSYAGKMYYGIAKCSPEDQFDYGFGVELAKARCDTAISWAKVVRSQQKIDVYRACVERFKKMLEDEMSYEVSLNKKYLEALSELQYQESKA